MRRSLALLALAAPLLAAEPPSVELVVLGENPTLLRIDVEVDGRPHAAVSADAVAAAFKFADVNVDGTLDKNESKRVLSALRVRQLGWGYLWATPDAAEWSDLDSNSDGKVTLDELAAYYQKQLVDVPQVGVAHTPPAKSLTDAILKRLDADRDGRVTEADWKGFDAALKPLDQDEDELIRPNELVPRTVYPGSAGGVMLAPGDKPLPKPLHELPLRRLGPDDAAVRTAAGDGGTFLRLGPHTEASLRVAGLTVRTSHVDSTLNADFASARKAALDRFAAVDGNADDALDAAEIKQAGYAPLRGHGSVADRSGDVRLTRAEWEGYLELRGKLVAAQATWTVFDHGRGLFEAIDADADGGLSVRELRGAWKRLNDLGCVVDGKLDAAKLPHTVRLVASRGRPTSFARAVPSQGPDWFKAMDRNGDGDVSRREFVGKEDDFRRLDADADGLLSAKEAATAKGR